MSIGTKPKYLEELIPRLKSIENKVSCFSYFQGGVRQMKEGNFKLVIIRN